MQLSEMRDLIPEVNSAHSFMSYVSKEVDVPHLDTMIGMGLDVEKFTRFILMGNRDDLFDHMIDNPEFVRTLGGNLNACSPYAFDRSLSIGVIPQVSDIYHAAKNGDKNKLSKLIIRGGDINGTPEMKDPFRCVLQGAISNGHTDIVHYLMSMGAKVGPWCLTDAIKARNHELFVTFLDANIELSPKTLEQLRNLYRGTSPEIVEEMEKRRLVTPIS